MQHPDDGTKVTSGSTHPEEGTIHAWLDGELSPAEVEVLRTHLADCAECRAVVAEARGLVAASSRILRSLDDGPGGVHASSDSDMSSSAGSRTSREAIGAGTVADRSPSVPVAGDSAIRSIRGARKVEFGTAAGARMGRRWRLSAIAAVGLMAVGTTLVLQRSGPLAPLAVEQATDQAAVTSPEVAAAADSEIPVRSPAAEGETEPTARQAKRGSADLAEARIASPSADSPLAEKAATAAAERAEVAPVVTPPRPPQSIAATGVAGGTAIPDSTGTRLSASAPPSRSTSLYLRGGAALARAQAGEVAAPPPPAPVEAPVLAVGPVLVGRVTSEEGEPVADALVTVPGTSSAAITDVAGRFRLAGMPTGAHTATVRRTGFEPARVMLRVGEVGDSVVAVALIPAESRLQDVVVTGIAASPVPPAAEAESARRAQVGQSRAPSIISPPARPPAVTSSPVSSGTDSAPRDGAARVASVQRLEGCYRLEVGGAPGAGRDSVETALPGWIQLVNSPAADRPGWLLATPLRTDQRVSVGSAVWRIADGEEVQIAWPTASGSREIILRLLGSGEVLTGTAALRSEGASTTDEHEAASIVAVRGVCNY